MACLPSSWRDSAALASAQSMLRSAPCASVKLTTRSGALRRGSARRRLELVVALDGPEAGRAWLPSLSGDSKSALLAGTLAFVREDLGTKARSDLVVAQALDDLVEEAEVVVELRHVLGELVACQALRRRRRSVMTMPSDARLTMTSTYSRSSLMYCSNLPFLMRKSGGCAM